MMLGHDYTGVKGLGKTTTQVKCSYFFLAGVHDAVLGCNLENDRMISVCLQGKPFNITISKSMPQPVMPKKLKLNGSMKTYKNF